MRTIITTIALFMSVAGFAQEGTVKGTVTNASSKPLAAATVMLLRAADSSLKKSEVSNNEGQYQFEKIKAGKYLVKVTSVNHKDWYSSPFDVAEGATVTAPAASLAVAEKKLKEVTVSSARKPMIEVKADRTVFNVENSINATGSNAMELLQKSPGITVDKDDNISMKGKNGVRIYIDGKPSPMDGKDLANYLRSVQSSDIESIELIENPSAKYDASGNAGIVNIKFKKNKKYGTNGSASTTFMQGIYPKYEGSLSLNHRNKKVNTFSNASINRWHGENYLDLYRLQVDSIYDQNSTNFNNNTSGNIKAGIDYTIDSRNTVGVMFNGNYSTNHWTSAGHTIISPQDTKLPIQVLNAGNDVPGNNSNSTVNFNYRFADTSGHELNVDADRGFYRGRSNSLQPNRYVNFNTGEVLRERIFANSTPINIDIYTAKADYEQNLFKGKFGFGGKYASVKTDNTFSFYNVLDGVKVQDWERSNHFNYTETVSAGYVNYNHTFKNWSFQLGVRAEHTNSEGILYAKSRATMADTTETVKRSYLDWFPSGAVSYTLSAKHQFNLNYSRRIDRPQYHDLNPFENKLDELTYEKGNPFLNPQYTNSFSLSHTYNSFLTTSLAFSHIGGYIIPITDTTHTNASFITNKNLGAQDVYSINISAPFNIRKWWSVYANLNANRTHLKANFKDGRIIDLNVTTVNFYNQHTFTLGKGYTAELSGWLNTPSLWGTFRNNFMWSADAGLQKTLFNNKATAKLSFTDIFRTNHWTSVSDFGGIHINAKGGWDSRQVRLSFQYRFGSSQVQRSRERKTGIEEETKRI